MKLRFWPGRITKSELRFKLVNAETANRRLTAELEEAQQLAAGFAADCVRLEDDKRRLEASLSGVREELRQVRRDHALAEQAAAELTVTVGGLGLAMAELEQAVERKDFLDQDHRYVRLMDGAEDHL